MRHALWGKVLPNQAKDLICGLTYFSISKFYLINNLFLVRKLYNLSATQNVNTFADFVRTFLIHVLRRPRISAIAIAQHAAKRHDSILLTKF